MEKKQLLFMFCNLFMSDGKVEHGVYMWINTRVAQLLTYGYEMCIISKKNKGANIKGWAQLQT